ncbi:MAG: FixH family protein, partial [Ignavibacteria bacterium]
MKSCYFIYFLLLSFILFNCNKENPVESPPTSSNYNRILTIDTSGYTIEMYSKTASTLQVGYNELGFRVLKDGVERNTGFLQFVPIMYHTSSSHPTPVQDTFYYNNFDKLFTGYACFIMISDTTSVWAADYNFNNELTIRKSKFDVFPSPVAQIRFWLDLQTNNVYLLTLIKPANPSTGLNNYEIILHRTPDQTVYYEVDSAEFFIRPWMPAHGHGSSNNINPAFTGNGKYEGKVNFTMPGQWYVYDSIKVN